MPKVSVIIPTYNRKDYVQEAIESVLAQTYTEYEIIVIDDGSTDDTREVLTARYGDRIRYFWQENQGESTARNRGIEMSKGEYIALLDSDDLWLPEKLAKQVPILGDRPDVGIVSAQAWLVDASGHRLESPPTGHDLESTNITLEQLCSKCDIAVSATLIRRSALEQAGGFDSNIQFGEDWDLWLRLALGWKLVILREPLTLFRKHSDSQHHFPNAQQAKHQLSDRLLMFEKAFSLSPESFTEELKRSITAREYGLAAFIQHAVGRGEAGRQYLSQAAQLYPADWTDTHHLADELVSIALRAIAAEGYGSVESGIGCVEEAIAYWPPSIPLPTNWKRKTLSKVYAGVGFQSFKRGDRELARSCLLRALILDRSWLKNIGVLSMIGESTLGTSTMKILRKLASFRRQKSLALI